jgi:hypothetical protein
MIPGINLLNLALTVIEPQGVEWHKFGARTQNALGQWITTYQPGVAIWGSWQPLESKRYAELGLDLAKRYFVFYTSNDLTGVERGESGDVLIWNGRKFQIQDDTVWYQMDGWDGIICVDIGPGMTP